MDNRRRRIYEIKKAYHQTLVCMSKFDQMILKISSIEKAIEEIEDKIGDATVDLHVTERKLNNNNNNNNKNYSKYKALLRERIDSKKLIGRLHIAKKKWERAKKRIQNNAKKCLKEIVEYLELNPTNTRTKNRYNYYNHKFNVPN